jgi:hypothetical protein
MNEQGIHVTRPILRDDTSIWFSAFGWGWGYCAFALPVEAVCKELGAANTTPGQLGLAFELGKPRIVRAIEQRAPANQGQRIPLDAADLARA